MPQIYARARRMMAIKLFTILWLAGAAGIISLWWMQLPIPESEQLQLPLWGLTKLGVDSRLTSGGDYTISRAWCEAIYHHPLQVDGIRYFSRHDNTRLCCGLFERSKLQLKEKNLGNLINFDVTKFAEILEIYDYGIA